VTDDAGEDLIGPAAAPTDRIRNVVDRAGAERQEERQRFVAVDPPEAGERAVIAPVAATDGEDLRAALLEVARHVLDRGQRLGDPDGAILTDQVGEPPRALASAVAVRPRVRVDDDTAPGHVSPPPPQPPAPRRPPGCS